MSSYEAIPAVERLCVVNVESQSLPGLVPVGTPRQPALNAGGKEVRKRHYSLTITWSGAWSIAPLSHSLAASCRSQSGNGSEGTNR